MAMKSKLAFVYLLLGSVPGYSQEASAEKPGLAALDIKASHGVPPELAQLMGEILLSELKSSGQFGSVLGSSDMQAMLDLEQQKTALGCDEDSCLAQLGGALGVPYLLTASLGKLGSSFVVTIKIIEVDAAEVKVRAVENAAQEDHLRPVVTYLVALANAELFGGDKPAKPSFKSMAPSVSDGSRKPLNKRRLAQLTGSVFAIAGLGMYTYSAQQVSRGEQLVSDSGTGICRDGTVFAPGSNCDKRQQGGALVETWAPRRTGGLVMTGLGLLTAAASFIF